MDPHPAAGMLREERMLDELDLAIPYDLGRILLVVDREPIAVV